MATLSIQELGHRAQNVISYIDRFLRNQNIAEAILTPYRQFCRSDDTRRLHISERPITDEMRLRLRFECMCFSAFCVTLQSSKYLMEKKWFAKRSNRRLIELFDGALATALIEFCNSTGMSELREITLVAYAPNPTFGFGGHLDPLDRLEEYRAAFVKTRGSELERFGKWIGKALDPPNYPLFEIIGGTFGTSLLQQSNEAMVSVFMRG